MNKESRTKLQEHIRNGILHPWLRLRIRFDFESVLS